MPTLPPAAACLGLLPRFKEFDLTSESSMWNLLKSICHENIYISTQNYTNLGGIQVQLWVVFLWGILILQSLFLTSHPTSLVHPSASAVWSGSAGFWVGSGDIQSCWNLSEAPASAEWGPAASETLGVLQVTWTHRVRLSLCISSRGQHGKKHWKVITPQQKWEIILNCQRPPHSLGLTLTHNMIKIIIQYTEPTPQKGVLKVTRTRSFSQATRHGNCLGIRQLNASAVLQFQCAQWELYDCVSLYS